MSNRDFFAASRATIEHFDSWLRSLTAPLLPMREEETEHGLRLHFKHEVPHSAMIGKLVRVTSAVRASLLLAETGFITEAGVLLRCISDFCAEIMFIGESLRPDCQQTAAMSTFVKQYFQSRPSTPSELKSSEKTRYVGREDLAKAINRLGQETQIDIIQLQDTRSFLHMTYDAYAHGAYETTMELFDIDRQRFALRGETQTEQRNEMIEAILLVVHSVVSTIELTAALNGNDQVWTEAKQHRRLLDELAQTES